MSVSASASASVLKKGFTGVEVKFVRNRPQYAAGGKGGGGAVLLLWRACEGCVGGRGRKGKMHFPSSFGILFVAVQFQRKGG